MHGDEAMHEDEAMERVISSLEVMLHFAARAALVWASWFSIVQRHMQGSRSGRTAQRACHVRACFWGQRRNGGTYRDKGAPTGPGPAACLPACRLFFMGALCYRLAGPGPPEPASCGGQVRQPGLLLVRPPTPLLAAVSSSASICHCQRVRQWEPHCSP